MNNDLDIGGQLDTDFEEFTNELSQVQNEVENRDKINGEIEKKKEELNITDDEKLKEVLPKQNAAKYGKVELVRLDDISLTEKGSLTRTEFFKKLDTKTQLYGNLTFTSQEAKEVMSYYSRVSIGVNSVVGMRCTGDKCPFREDCPYQMMNKAPIGKPCIIENDLLSYHTQRFMEQFEVDPEDHSELMLVQELSELLVYEMRVTRILAMDGENSQLKFTEISFDAVGNEVENTKIHWAWELKERIKNRRMKLLESLNATRSSKKKVTENPVGASYYDFLTSIMEKAKTAQAQEVSYREDH